MADFDVSRILWLLIHVLMCLLSATCLPFDGDPPSTVWIAGETVSIPCNRRESFQSADWVRLFHGEEHEKEICLNTGICLDGYATQFSVDTNDFTLTMRNVAVNDSGEYTCIAYKGATYSRHTTKLSVIAGDPSRIVSTTGDTVRIPCNSREPFKSADWARMVHGEAHEKEICLNTGICPNGYARRFSVDTKNSFTLTIRNVTVNDAGEYTCIAYNMHANYGRYTAGLNVNTETHSTVGQRQMLDSTYSYSTALAVSSQPLSPTDAKAVLAATSATGTLQTAVIIIASLFCATLLVVLITIAWFKARHFPCFSQKTHGTGAVGDGELHLLRQLGNVVVLCKAANIDTFQGAAISKHLILLLTEKDCKIRVFSTDENNEELKPINIKCLVPRDIVFCEESKCFYVADKPPREMGRLWRISEKRCVTKWLLANEAPDYNIIPNSLSVRSGRLLIVSDNSELLLFDVQSRQLVKHINPILPDSKSVYITHAAETPSGQFVVCNWEPENRVLLLDANGNFAGAIGRYGDLELGLLRPYNVQVCGDGRVIVADSGNNRIVLLDADLQFKRIIEFGGINRLSNPWQLHFQEHTGKMVITCREKCVFLVRNFRLDDVSAEDDHA